MLRWNGLIMTPASWRITAAYRSPSRNRVVLSLLQKNSLLCKRNMVTWVSRHPCSWNNIYTTVSRTLQPMQSSHRATQLAFSTTTTATASTTAPSSRATFWRRFAALVRIIRIPALVVSVFSLGYQQGIVDCTRNPQAQQEQILRSVLAGVGVENWEQVKTLSEQDISYVNRSKHHQVAVVGDRIITAARDLVQEELDKAMQDVQRNLPEDILPEDALKYIKADSKVEFWFNASQRLMGEVNSTHMLVDMLLADSPVNSKKLKRVPWQYVFVETNLPNAFVSEILPQRIFITSAMLNLATTPNELAFVLGHEISHLILGHVSQTNRMETFLRTVEILLLSIDPTSGVLSLFVIGGLVAMRKALAAANSRENEQEADEMGLQITARACFDTVAGSEIMYKMHEAKEGMTKRPTPGGNKSDEAKPQTVPTEVQLFDTHPPTMERYERLKEAAEGGENYTKYRHAQCATVSSRIAAALGWN